MKSLTENYLSMLKVLLNLLKANSTLLSRFSEFNALVVKLELRINSIDAMIRSVEVSTKGLTLEKHEIKAMIARGLGVLASVIGAYANETNNTQLKDYIKYREYELLRMRDDLLYDIALIIYNKANELSAELEGYGVDADALIEVQRIINLYNEKSPNAKRAKTDAKAMRELLDAYVVETHSIVKESMDKAAEVFKIIAPLFYLKYKNARKVYKTGHKRIIADDKEETTGSINLIVLDKESLAPIMNAVFEIVLLALSDDTDEDGNGYIDSLLPGSYAVTISHELYATVEITVVVNAKESTEVEVLMEKLAESI